MAKIKVAIFDLGGVLYTLDYDTMLEGFFRVSGRSIQEIIDILTFPDIFYPLEKGEISSHQYYLEVINRFRCEMSFQEFGRIWNSLLVKRKEVFNFVRALKNQVKLAILSNTNEINLEYMASHLDGIFDVTVYSCRVGCMKPQPEIYRITLERAGVLPSEALFIDDLKQNVEAAQMLGICSHLYTELDKLKKFLKNYGLV